MPYSCQALGIVQAMWSFNQRLYKYAQVEIRASQAVSVLALQNLKHALFSGIENVLLFFFFFSCAIGCCFISALWIKKKMASQTSTGHQQSSNCYVNCQLRLTSQLISAEWLSSFTWAISSPVSKTIENSRETARPRWLCLTLKSFLFSCSG